MFSMQEFEYVNIIDKKGNTVSRIDFGKKLVPVLKRRVLQDKNGLFYKGAGCFYKRHYTNEPDEFDEIIAENNIQYSKYIVQNKNLISKFGIFEIKYQPYFSDFIGGCSTKEEKIIENSKNFKYTSIKNVEDVIDTGICNHKIYVYSIKDRQELKSHPQSIENLIEYIVKSNYNTAWDKQTFRDIDFFGYIRDIADWFLSDKFIHKLGSVYSILFSFFKYDKKTLCQVLKFFGFNSNDKFCAVYCAAKIIEKIQPEIIPPELDLNNFNLELYKNLMVNYLFEGKACCHLENEEEWSFAKDKIKEAFLKDFYLKNIEQ